MKKIITSLMMSIALIGMVYGQVSSYSAPNMITEINAGLAGKLTNTLAAGKIWIGNAAGNAAAQTASGLWTINAGGTNSASTTGLAVTNATVAITPQAPSAVTPTITVTAQRPGAQTPTITVTPLAPSTVTPIITVTPAVGAIAASGANNVVTITNYYNPVQQTVSLTDTNAVTALVVTNITWSTAVYSFATNTVVVVAVTGGGAVMTNATAASSALPDFITNATALSSALLDYPTNATATSSALPLFATNATAAVTKETATFVKP